MRHKEVVRSAGVEPAWISAEDPVPIDTLFRDDRNHDQNRDGVNSPQAEEYISQQADAQDS
jgi:hypothetical protein